MNKKILAILPVLLMTTTVMAVPNWDISGVWTWVQYDYEGGTGYPHIMTIYTQNFDVCTGDFTGTGVQVDDSTNTWTVTGNVDGDGIKFQLKCDPGSLYEGYILNAAGTIASDGETMSGSGNDNYGRTTPWEAYGNTAVAPEVCEEICPEGYVQAETPMETLTVDSTISTDTSSSVLTSGYYVLEASGTWNNQGGANKLDAEYSTIDNWVTVDNGYDHSPYFLGEGFGDLQVNQQFVDWGTYNTAHEYSIVYTGTGSAVNLRIFDGDSTALPPIPNLGWYGDNSGSLQVDIYKCVPECQPTTEVCDGVDNDCDGLIDEDYVETPTSCGVGECATTGKMTCVDGKEVDTCKAGTPTAEICDGKDNDCNGKIDDGINIDADHDGVNDCNADFCPNTIADTSYKTLGEGMNRWIWNGNMWVTVLPTKGKGPASLFANPSISDYTYGCSCEQILNYLHKNYPETYGAMLGHYKYGCSRSILEDWHNGLYYIETVTVPANKDTATLSSLALQNGKNYELKAYGTATACNEPGCVITFDAEYSTSDGTNWINGVAPPYDGYGSNLLDLMVNGGYVHWGTYNSAHTYWLPVTGTGSKLPLQVYDIYYPNNVGSLNVDIYAKL